MAKIEKKRLIVEQKKSNEGFILFDIILYTLHGWSYAPTKAWRTEDNTPPNIYYTIGGVMLKNQNVSSN